MCFTSQRLRIALIVLAAAAPLGAQRIADTFAGTDWIFAADGLPGRDVPISNEARGIAVGPDGLLYLADARNNVVLRLNGSGTVTVVAGNGIEGYSGDGGPGTRASINHPTDVAFDPQGNLYIAEFWGDRIRRLDRNGAISTFVEMDNVWSIAVGLDGTVYASRSSDAAIYAVRPGVERIVAGDGSDDGGFSGDGGPATQAQIDTELRLEVAPSGLLYFSEWDNNRVRFIDAAGIMHTFAGDGVEATSGDGGPAVEASLNTPTGLAFDGAGNLYICTESSVVRRVTPDGMIETAIGSRRFGYDGDGGLATDAAFRFPLDAAVDPSGNVYVLDDGSSNVRKVNPAGIIDTAAGNGEYRKVPDGTPAALGFFFEPVGLAFDSAGNLLVADNENNRVRRISPDRRLFEFAGTGADACCQSGGPASNALIGGPRHVLPGPSGEVYISVEFYDVVHRVAPDGVIDIFAGGRTTGFGGDGGPATDALLDTPEGLALDAAGKLYIADRRNNRIRVVAPDGTIDTFAGTGESGFSGDGGPATRAAFWEPRGLAFDTAGNLLIADTLNNRVRMISPDGIVSTLAGDGIRASDGDGGLATQASVDLPGSLAVGPDGSIYVAEWGGEYVRAVDTRGRISTLAGTGERGFGGDGGLATAAQFAFPLGIAVDGGGNVFVADTGNNRIRIIPTALPSISAFPTGIDLGDVREGSFSGAVSLEINGSIPGLPVSVSTTTPWLTILGADPGNLVSPADVPVRASAVNLPLGASVGMVRVQSPVAIPSRIDIPVLINVTRAEPAELSLSSESLTYSFLQGDAAQAKTVQVRNAGGGSLPFALLSPPDGPAIPSWLSVSPRAGVSAPSAPANLNFAANPAGLSAGTYTATVTVCEAAGGVCLPSAESQRREVKVTMTITRPQRQILLSQSGLHFVAVVNGGAPSPQSFGVLNVGDGAMAWTASASTLSGGPSWLRLGQGSGTVQRPFLDSSPVEVIIDHSGLAADDYFGRIEVVAEADNSPQSVTVSLTVLREGSNPGPDVQPTGLIFTGTAGTAPGSQPVNVTNLSAADITYLSSNIGDWYSHLPGRSTVAPNRPRQITVQTKSSGLPAGIRRGVITLQFQESGAIRTINLLSVGAPAGRALSQEGAGQQAGCDPTKLRVLHTSLPDNFLATEGQSSKVSVRVVDECGNPLQPQEGQPMPTVTARLSQGTNENQFGLNHVGGGVWEASWEPLNFGNQGIEVDAGGRTPGGAETSGTGSIPGTVVPGNDIQPRFGAGDVAHGASFLRDSRISPGGLISIFGTRLAADVGTAASVPLPDNLLGTEVFLGSQKLPLLYVGPGQINAQVPYELPLNTQHQLTVRRGLTLSSPQSITLSAVQPGIFQDASTGLGIITHADGFTPAWPATPASRGDVVVIYATGLGPVDPPVASGVAAPSSPLSRTTAAASVTIGGEAAPNFFSGLTPGSVGLYQVNVTIPESAPLGDAVAVQLEIGGQAAPGVNMAIR